MNRLKKISCLFYYLAKRQLKKRSLWMVFLFFLGIVIFFPELTQEENSMVKIGLFIEKKENFSIQEEANVVEKLQRKHAEDSLFSFVEYEEKEVLQKDILSGKLECGYVIPTDLWEKLMRGKTKNLVTLYTTSTTTLDSVCNEVVYAALYEEYALFVLNDYLISTKEIFYDDGEKVYSMTEPIYRNYLIDGSTFGFKIMENSDKGENRNDSREKNILLYPMRGFLAVFMLVCGFCGAMLHYEDREKHIFIRCNKNEQNLVRFISISIPVIFSYPIILISLWTSGIFTTWFQEISSLSLYGMLVILFCGVLTYCLRDKIVFCSWIPLLLIGCLVFTPVLVDISSFIPQVRWVEKLFVPYYYLRLFL